MEQVPPLAVLGAKTPLRAAVSPKSLPTVAQGETPRAAFDSSDVGTSLVFRPCVFVRVRVRVRVGVIVLVPVIVPAPPRSS